MSFIQKRKDGYKMVERLDDLERIRRHIKELEAKIVELSKVVENLVSEVMYIKAELRKSERKEGSEKSTKLEVKEESKDKVDSDSDDDIIIVDQA